MNVTQIVGVLLAVAVVAVGATAAAPGNAPTDAPSAQGDDHPSDQADADRAGTDAAPGDDPADAADVANASDGHENGSVAARSATGATGGHGPPADAGERGPPTDLPAQVPDFVSQIHETIGQHPDGALEGSLGDHVSDLTPEDAEDGEAAGNETDATTPDPTPEATATAV